MGEVRAYKTCAACDGAGKVSAEKLQAAAPPADPRVHHTAADEKRRRKHGGAR